MLCTGRCFGVPIVRREALLLAGSGHLGGGGGWMLVRRGNLCLAQGWMGAPSRLVHLSVMCRLGGQRTHCRCRQIRKLLQVLLQIFQSYLLLRHLRRLWRSVDLLLHPRWREPISGGRAVASDGGMTLSIQLHRRRVSGSLPIHRSAKTTISS